MTAKFHILLALLIAAVAFAPDSTADEQPDIVGHINETSGCTIVIPDALRQRLLPGNAPVDNVETEETSAPQRRGSAGWRVQAFSDNNARTARNEARSKEQQIAARFPQWRTYKKYSAPYWRLRVGDFRSQREAEEAAAELRQAFPTFSKEIRVVRDRINTVD